MCNCIPSLLQKAQYQLISCTQYPPGRTPRCTATWCCVKYNGNAASSEFPPLFSEFAISLEPYLHAIGFSLTELLFFPEQDQHAAASVLWLPPVISDLTVEFFLEVKSVCLSNSGSPTSALVIFWAKSFSAEGSCRVHCRVFIRIPVSTH